MGWMLGDFLEISLETRDILASLAFWEKLGFLQATTGDAWSHPYAVVTDGRLCLGLHQYRFASPALTFVTPELRRRIPDFEALGIAFEFCKIQPHEFNEAGFRDPDGQMVCLLEARTFSPRRPEREDATLCGWFGEYRMPVRSAEDSARFWDALGFVTTGISEARERRATLARTGLNLGADESRTLRGPALVFHVENLAAQAEKLAAADFDVRPLGSPRALLLHTPDGVDLHFVEEPPV